MSYDYKEIVPYLLHWFDYNARILPWRENPKPYYVWISEIMLQQTRVEAVKGYFDRFITALPDIRSLAEAEEERLLKLWEGLGYYSRVRNLKKTAQIVIRDYGGELPSEYSELMKLPGIGTYTAGAVASIAFGKAIPAVDGNVLRVTKRLAGSFEDISKESVKKELIAELTVIIPKDHPGDFNQALMELGATVCLPNGKPLCAKCPVMHLCRAFHQDIVMELPVKPDKKERKRVERTILLMEYQDRYIIRKRPDQGLLAGLWELPGIEEHLTLQGVRRILKEWGLAIDEIEPMGKAKHIFSHIEWHMLGYRIRLKELADGYPEGSQVRWADKQEIREVYALPNAFAAYTDIITEDKPE